MTATELAEQDARQAAYDAMLARQQAFEDGLQVAAKKDDPVRVGCVFAKSCKLPDAIINYSNPSGMERWQSKKRIYEWDYSMVQWKFTLEPETI